MGSIRKKTFTKSLPLNAEVIVVKGETFAKVKPPKGRAVTYPVTTGKDGLPKIVVTSQTFVAKFRDGSGIIQEVSTGCRDEGAARSVLAELERRSELVKAGVITAGEDRIADHASTRLVEHFESYRVHLQARGRTTRHISKTVNYLKRLAVECGWSRLNDLQREGFDRWLAARR